MRVLVLCLFLTCVAPPVGALGVRAVCRRTCRAAIGACEGAGVKAGPCRRRTLRACHLDRAVCATTTTTSTTSTTTTTSTIAERSGHAWISDASGYAIFQSADVAATLRGNGHIDMTATAGSYGWDSCLAGRVVVLQDGHQWPLASVTLPDGSGACFVLAPHVTIDLRVAIAPGPDLARTLTLHWANLDCDAPGGSHCDLVL